MSRISLFLVFTLAFAIVNTVFLGVHIVVPQATPKSLSILSDTQSIPGVAFAGSNAVSNGVSGGTTQPAFQFFLDNSSVFSTAGWMFVGGVWIWRGRVKSRWESLGFDSGLFDLFIKMKGSKTRTNLLDSLYEPKDRFQLAQELGLDWKAVDYHVTLLNKYDLIREDHAFGNAKMYRLTKQGEMLLELLKEFNQGVASGPISSSLGKSNPAVNEPL